MPTRLPLPRWPAPDAAGAGAVLAAALSAALACGPAVAQDRPVYRCPGPPVLYTDTLSAQEARAKGCRLIEGAPVTVVPTGRPRAAAPASAPSGMRSAESRVDPAEQRARDSDARRILADELRREEERLAVLRAEYNNGEPERRGDERNYQRYLDRVADLKVAIQRKESDVAALRRELAKLAPQ